MKACLYLMKYLCRIHESQIKLNSMVTIKNLFQIIYDACVNGELKSQSRTIFRCFNATTYNAYWMRKGSRAYAAIKKWSDVHVYMCVRGQRAQNMNSKIKATLYIYTCNKDRCWRARVIYEKKLSWAGGGGENWDIKYVLYIFSHPQSDTSLCWSLSDAERRALLLRAI